MVYNICNCLYILESDNAMTSKLCTFWIKRVCTQHYQHVIINGVNWNSCTGSSAWSDGVNLEGFAVL